MTTPLQAFDSAWRACKIDHQTALMACNWNDHRPRMVDARVRMCSWLRDQGYGLEAIARIIGNTHHTSVMHAIQRIDEIPEDVPPTPNVAVSRAYAECGIDEATWGYKVRQWRTCRVRDVVERRGKLVAWLHEHEGMSYPAIADALGASNYSTVLYSHKRANRKGAHP